MPDAYLRIASLESDYEKLSNAYRQEHTELLEARSRITELERDRQEMAMLIRRLLYRLRNDETSAKVRQQTTDYLLRKGLGGNLLRADKEAGELPRC